MRTIKRILPVISLSGIVWAIAACQVPVRRESVAAPKVASASSDQQHAECEQIRSDIRYRRQLSRQAPSTSISPEIVAAQQGKEDREIDDLQSRYDELDCPGGSDGGGGESSKPVTLPAAPGGPNP